MKHFRTATLSLAAVLAASIGVASPASAHEAAHFADCAGVDFNLSGYSTKPGTPEGEKVLISAEVLAQDAVYDTVVHPGQPAVYETVVHPGQPAVYETVVIHPAVEAKGETKYKFVHAETGDVKWKDSPSWNAEGNEHSTGWSHTGESKWEEKHPAKPAVTKEVLVSEAVPERTEERLVSEAVPERTEQVLVSEAVAYQAAVYGPGAPAVEGEAAPNRVTVAIDGTVVLSESFGESLVREDINDLGGEGARSYTITIDSWIDSEDRTLSGTFEEPCLPAVPEQPQDIVTVADAFVVDCEGLTLTGTATTTVTTHIFDRATWTWVAAEPVVTVETATFDITEEEAIELGCEYEVVTPPTEPEVPVTPVPPVVTPVVNPVVPATPVPVVHPVARPVVEQDVLAETGTEPVVALGTAALAIAAGAGMLALRRRFATN